MKWTTVLLLCAVHQLHAQAPKDPQERDFQKAVELDSLGQYAKAVKLLDGLVDHSDWAYKARLRRSDILFFHLDRYQDAFNDMAELVRIAPDSLAPFLNRSNMYLSADMPDRALADLDKAIKRCADGDDSTTVYVNMSAAYLSQRKFDDVLRSTDQAMAIDPEDYGALTNRSVALDEMGRIDEAKRILIKLHEQRPKEIAILNNLGFLTSKAGEHAEAITWFEKARELAPDDAVVINNLGYAMLQGGRPEEALKLVQRSIKIAPGNSYAYRNLGLIWLEKKETDKACEAFEAALARGFTAHYGPEVDQLRRQHCH